MKQTSASLEQKRDKVDVSLPLAEIKYLVCHRGGGGDGERIHLIFPISFLLPCFSSNHKAVVEVMKG